MKTHLIILKVLDNYYRKNKLKKKKKYLTVFQNLKYDSAFIVYKDIFMIKLL